MFRLFDGHQHLIDVFMANPSLIGGIDTYGIELIHPRREGRSKRQIGRKGISNPMDCRWKTLLHNHLGLIVNGTATLPMYMMGVPSNISLMGSVTRWLFLPMFAKADWFPSNLRLCRRGEWNSRMLVETILSMLTLVCHFKKVMHRRWSYFKTRVGFTMALFNLSVEWIVD